MLTLSKSSVKEVARRSHNLSSGSVSRAVCWLSCNGESWGVGPTAVFASAAALFLYNEIVGSALAAADPTDPHLAPLERTLLTTMVLGMLALMVHLWVCSTRFFQYYLESLIKDSPNVLLEMTTAGLLGSRAEMLPTGPMMRFLHQQQPQIHITVCWFLSLCYADYVRKNHCQCFTIPYLEQWQTALRTRASNSVHCLMVRVNDLVRAMQQHLQGCGITVLEAPCSPCSQPTQPTSRPHSGKSPARAKEGVSRTASERSCGPHLGCNKPSCNRPSSCRSRVSVTEAIESLKIYIALLEWAKCGEEAWSVLPTIVWGLGAAALSHRLLTTFFQRFLFRRIPLWERILQNLLFIWMVIYSLRFWIVLVHLLRILTGDYEGSTEMSSGEEDRLLWHLVKECLVWILCAVPLEVFIHTRSSYEHPRLMIWITANPWQWCEMGPHDYYLRRPLPSLQAQNGGESTSSRDYVFSLRRAHSDSEVAAKPPKRKRHSKSC